MISKLIKEILENNNNVQKLKETLNTSMHSNNNKKRSKIIEALNSSSVRVFNRPLKRTLQLQELQVKQYVLYFLFQAFWGKGLAFCFLRFPAGDALGAQNTITASFHATVWNTPEFNRSVVIFADEAPVNITWINWRVGCISQVLCRVFRGFFSIPIYSWCCASATLWSVLLPTAGKCHGPSWPWRGLFSSVSVSVLVVGWIFCPFLGFLGFSWAFKAAFKDWLVHIFLIKSLSPMGVIRPCAELICPV